MAAANQNSGAQDPAEVMERIRALNEQILEKSREAGSGFLDEYENSLRAVADFQERAAEGASTEWLTQILKAQTDFTREVAKVSVAAARQLVK
jgi:hypothetical protein